MAGVEKILDLGDAVAVVATNTWLAQQAVDAIDVTWDPAPYPDTTDAIFDEIARSFGNAPNSTMRDDGDVDTPPEGATVIEAEYRLPYLAHATMEPMNATALYTGDGPTDLGAEPGPDRGAEKRSSARRSGKRRG